MGEVSINIQTLEVRHKYSKKYSLNPFDYQQTDRQESSALDAEHNTTRKGLTHERFAN